MNYGIIIIAPSSIILRDNNYMATSYNIYFFVNLTISTGVKLTGRRTREVRGGGNEGS